MSAIRIKRRRQVDRTTNFKVLKTMPYMTFTRETVLDTRMEGIGFVIVHGCKIMITDEENGSGSRKQISPHCDGLA